MHSATTPAAASKDEHPITYKQGRYYSAIWFVRGQDMDFCAWLWRDLPRGVWTLTFRFRYEKAGGDERNWYVVESADEERALRGAQECAEGLVERGFSRDGKIHKLRPCSDDPVAIMVMLQREDWMQFKDENGKPWTGDAV